MDTITLSDIEVWTHIGVPDAERSRPQRLLVSVELFGSLKATGTSDDVIQGIDYKTVTDEIVKLGLSERKTIERFAEDAATMVLKQFKPESVKVCISKKTDLPLASACVTILRP